ncbi:MAG: glycoside hydrolase family 2 protein [Clostridia bacterium]|nr:glycoside hydrolase family 2 protein [Clostridia bacterium]
MLTTRISDWILHYGGEALTGRVPCSLYSILLQHGRIEDPYLRLNEKAATALSAKDCEMSTVVTVTREMLACTHLELCFYGLDTLCDVFVNGVKVLYADNMHRTWRVDVREHVRVGENAVRLHFYSPSEYITKKFNERYLFTATAGGAVMEGIGYIRKSLCMFGWDWGPKLPDMGLYRDVTLEAYDARITDLRITQRHEAGRVTLSLAVAAEKGSAVAEIVSPVGETWTEVLDGETEIAIDEPMLWWPNGLGEQHLYTVSVTLSDGERVLDTATRKIGLRTLTVSTQKDRYGEEFCHVVNGVKFFAMGADYVPEDSILANRSPARTERLLTDCVKANFNAIRVWGGGFYPDDDFYEICDRLGLVVWQDFMFACMNVYLTPEFEENILREAEDVVRRIRHHACIGLLCGNNEMELALIDWSSCIPSNSPKVFADYLRLYQTLLPEVCARLAPEIFYWPASPSSHGYFDDPNSEDMGDNHYWRVWHGGVPFEEYRKHYFRYCSEFGFEAFPSMKTLRAIALPEDMAVESEVMLSHQKCLSGNQKMAAYMKDYYRVPEDFASFVYLSQLLQADAIRYGVEHFRRHRGRCMGALYWQLNDCWPTSSWSSVDYFGRWKALHYRARKFFAPVLISLHEEGERKLVNISNETRSRFDGVIRLKVRKNDFSALYSCHMEISVKAQSSVDIEFPGRVCALFEGNDDIYLEYTLEDRNAAVIESDGKIYKKPCDYRFEDPRLRATVAEENGAYYLDITADRFAKSVMIEWENADVTPEDNFFDITSGKKRVRLIGEREAILSEAPRLISVYDVQAAP